MDKKITGLEVAEMLGMEDIYNISLINEGYNSKEVAVVGTIDDVEM
jgi:hypothetical protein